MDDIIKEFLIESYENLDQLDRDLVELEKTPTSGPLLASVFRTIHTIKGTAGFLALGKLESLAHVAESLLSGLRDGKFQLNEEITEALLAAVDGIRQMLGSLETREVEGDGDYTALIATLSRLQETAKNETLPPVAEREAPSAESASVLSPAPEAESSAMTLKSPASVTTGLATVPKPGVSSPEAVKQPEAMEATAVSNSSIRIDVSLLDRLMNLVGELVLARNQILQVTEKSQESSLGAMSQHLNLITTELQEIAMKTRMQPIGNIWSKFPRVVRDIASDLGKKVELSMSGAETELDRSVIEAIKDPLVHIIRNAIDHGIEKPALRRAKKKPEMSWLQLRAFHESGQVNIELSDDGAGIDPKKIKVKVIERGLLTADHVNRLTENELIQLVFLPGFSTAEKVTNVSGRGVGMDVVKTNVEKIGGTVELTSIPGEGTTVRIRIPLTLAIIPALIVQAGQERYAIPQPNLVELLQVGEGTGTKQIEYIHGAPVYRLRGKLLPLLFLNRELCLEALTDGTAQAEASNLVVLRAGDRQFGLLVDAIQDSAEIVVKPLGAYFKNLSCYAGATIMGDGRVALILDVEGLAQKAQLHEETNSQKKELVPTIDKDQKTRQRLLLFQLGEQSHFAIHLSSVVRLEEVPLASIVRSSSGEVMEYRGEILPLLRIASVILHGECLPPPTSGAEQVVVYTEGGRSVGLVVGDIHDIIEESFDLKTTGCRPGVLGSAVIQKRVTEFLDVPAIVRAADPLFLQPLALSSSLS